MGPSTGVGVLPVSSRCVPGSPPVVVAVLWSMRLLAPALTGTLALPPTLLLLLPLLLRVRCGLWWKRDEGRGGGERGRRDACRWGRRQRWRVGHGTALRAVV